MCFIICRASKWVHLKWQKIINNNDFTLNVHWSKTLKLQNGLLKSLLKVKNHSWKCLFKYTEVAFYFTNSILSASSVFYFFFRKGYI